MAAVDYFLKLDQIDGESQDAKYSKWIQIESWSFGATQGGSFAYGGGGGAGKVQMQDFHFVMKLNRATPKLLELCAIGKHLPFAHLICRKAGGNQEEFLKIKFSDCLVSSYQTGGSGGADVIPMDQISLNFSKIEFEYYEQKPDGGVVLGGRAGWDQKKAVKV